jgi:hypothetical protein
MSENRNELIDTPFGTAEGASKTGPSLNSGDATYQVRFSKFGLSSKARNSFDLARRGEIAFSGADLVVRAFQREMWFLGTRIELAFSRTDITDVSQLANFVTFSIARPNQDVQTLQFLTQDEEDARRITQTLPKTLSAACVAVKEYEAQLKLLNRGDYVTKGLVAPAHATQIPQNSARGNRNWIKGISTSSL